MIITDILHVTDSTMDLYSSNYFKPEVGEGTINPCDKWVDGSLFGYGKVTERNKVRYRAVDIRSFCKKYGTIDLEADDPRYLEFLISNPLVPPRNRWVDNTHAELYATIREHLLGEYKTTPKYISIDQTLDFSASFGNHELPRMDGQMDYRHNSPDAVFSFVKVGRFDNYLPICNGFFCFPHIVENKLYATDGAHLSYNKKDRNRRWVLMDFTPVGGATFVPMKTQSGNMEEMLLNFDTTNKSLLFVVDGRLLMPEDYSVCGKRVVFKPNKINAVHELDRRLCRNEFEWNSDIIRTTTRDYKNLPNSFVLVVNNPNLQVVRHQAHAGECDTRYYTKDPTGKINDILEIDFDGCARGLLFDTSTKSVIDYARDENSLTLYADENYEAPLTIVLSTARIPVQGMLAVLSGSAHNSMSAKGIVMHNGKVDQDATLILPRYEILDFVIRG